MSNGFYKKSNFDLIPKERGSNHYFMPELFLCSDFYVCIFLQEDVLTKKLASRERARVSARSGTQTHALTHAPHLRVMNCAANHSLILRCEPGSVGRIHTPIAVFLLRLY